MVTSEDPGVTPMPPQPQQLPLSSTTRTPHCHTAAASHPLLWETSSDTSTKNDEAKSEFDIMAESNRHPLVDAERSNSTIALVATDVAGTGNGYVSGNGNGHITNHSTFWRRSASVNSKVANPSIRDDASSDIFFGTVGNVAREILNPASRRSVSRPEYSDIARNADTLPYKDDHHPAGEVAADYLSLGARPRRRQSRDTDAEPSLVADYDSSSTVPSFYNNSRDGVHTSHHNFALHSTLGPYHPREHLTAVSGSTDRTAHSSPSHSEYSFTRSSDSPTRSDHSNHSLSRNHQRSSAAGNAICTRDVIDVAGSSSSSLRGADVPATEDTARLALSSPESPAYNRPASPISREPEHK